jgi:PAS domain S-box-containing protein
MLEGLSPRLRIRTEAGGALPDDLRSLFSETLDAIQMTMEELRVTSEDLLQQHEAGLRVEAEEAARERFGRVFDALPDAVLVTDGDGVVRAANPAAGALLGLGHADLRGKPLAVFIDEEGRRAFRKALGDLRPLTRTERVELRMRPRDHLPIEVEATVAPLADASGELAWTLRDVTSRAAARSAAGDAEASLRAVLGSLPVPVAAMDLDGTVLAWNEAAARHLGWSEEEVLGLPNPAVPDEMESLLDALRASDPGAEPVRADAQGQRKGGGTVPLRLTLSRMTGAAGEVLGSVAVMAAADGEGETLAGGAASQGRSWSAVEARRVLLGGSGEAAFAERLRNGIAAGLHLGRLRPGDRLPSIRDAALAAATDHRVVSSAYQRLSAEGLVEVKNRRGASVASLPASEPPELAEAAEWLARALAEAFPLQLRVPQLPDLVRRWTSSGEVRCACVESTEDDLAALSHELAHHWGLKTFPVRVPEGDSAGRRALAEALRGVDLVVTTAFHAHAVRAVADALGKPLVIAGISPEVVDAVEARLRAGPLTAVVADPAYGERLRAVEGGERLRVVLAGDEAAVAALDPNEPVLLTGAAQRRIGRPLRMLVPPLHFVAPASAEAIARALVNANVEAARGRS